MRIQPLALLAVLALCIVVSSCKGKADGEGPDGVQPILPDAVTNTLRLAGSNLDLSDRVALVALPSMSEHLVDRLLPMRLEDAGREASVVDATYCGPLTDNGSSARIVALVFPGPPPDTRPAQRLPEDACSNELGAIAASLGPQVGWAAAATLRIVRSPGLVSIRLDQWAGAGPDATRGAETQSLLASLQASGRSLAEANTANVSLGGTSDPLYSADVGFVGPKITVLLTPMTSGDSGAEPGVVWSPDLPAELPPSTNSLLFAGEDAINRHLQSEMARGGLQLPGQSSGMTLSSARVEISEGSAVLRGTATSSGFQGTFDVEASWRGADLVLADVQLRVASVECEDSPDCDFKRQLAKTLAHEVGAAITERRRGQRFDPFAGFLLPMEIGGKRQQLSIATLRATATADAVVFTTQTFIVTVP